MEPIPDVPSPGTRFELERMVRLVRQGKMTDPLSETRGRTQDDAWIRELYPDWSGLESQDAALWVAATFYKTGQKVRFVVGFDNVDVPHMTHIWTEVWNPEAALWVAFDPNADAFADHQWQTFQFLEVSE